LAHVLEAVDQLGYPVVVAVPESDAEALGAHAPIVMAPPVADHDVLGRFAAVAGMLPWGSPIVRVTADCPLWDPGEGRRVMAAYHASPLEFATNVTDGYTDGEDVEIFSRRLLLVADQLAHDVHDREHVTPWMTRHTEMVTVPPIGPAKGKRSIDTPADLAALI
jgi:spore coat polysaccharide biosynthesis protein SpsF (cytidylyltransferase family)